MVVATLIKVTTAMVRVSFCEHFLRPSRPIYSLMLILRRSISCQNSFNYAESRRCEQHAGTSSLNIAENDAASAFLS